MNSSYPVYYGSGATAYLQDVRQMQEAQLKLAELKERQEAIEQNTGMNVQSYFEYEKNNPTPSAKSPLAPFFLGVVAGGLAVLFSATLPVVALAALGGFLAGVAIPEGKARHLVRSVERYEGYITATESVARTRVPAPVLGMGGHSQHAEAVLAERVQQQDVAATR